MYQLTSSGLKSDEQIHDVGAGHNRKKPVELSTKLAGRIEPVVS